MNDPAPQRKEFSQFWAEGICTNEMPWRILRISRSLAMGGIFDIIMFRAPKSIHASRIYAFETADYAFRPMNPNTILGGPEIKYSTTDPRLAEECLQFVPGGDGMTYNPRKKYQLLELDQSWIIAVRFEIEDLPFLKSP